MSIVCYKIIHSYDIGLDVLTLFQRVLNQTETAFDPPCFSATSWKTEAHRIPQVLGVNQNVSAPEGATDFSFFV